MFRDDEGTRTSVRFSTKFSFDLSLFFVVHALVRLNDAPFLSLECDAQLLSSFVPPRQMKWPAGVRCHRSRWWTRRRAAASASWKRPTLPTSSSRTWGRVSRPRRRWSVATPWPRSSPPTPKTGWASSRYGFSSLRAFSETQSIEDQPFYYSEWFYV